jgi:hypothetical protein
MIMQLASHRRRRRVIPVLVLWLASWCLLFCLGSVGAVEISHPAPAAALTSELPCHGMAPAPLDYIPSAAAPADLATDAGCAGCDLQDNQAVSPSLELPLALWFVWLSGLVDPEPQSGTPAPALPVTHPPPIALHLLHQVFLI